MICYADGDRQTGEMIDELIFELGVQSKVARYIEFSADTEVDKKTVASVSVSVDVGIAETGERINCEIASYPYKVLRVYSDVENGDMLVLEPVVKVAFETDRICDVILELDPKTEVGGIRSVLKSGGDADIDTYRLLSLLGVCADTQNSHNSNNKIFLHNIIK